MTPERTRTIVYFGFPIFLVNLLYGVGLVADNFLSDEPFNDDERTLIKYSYLATLAVAVVGGARHAYDSHQNEDNDGQYRRENERRAP